AVPLVRPVLAVVLVTLTINVLKIFDLVYVLPPESSQDDANVIALEMYRISFGGGLDHGRGSALGVLLFVLVLPAMLYNIRRLRRNRWQEDRCRAAPPRAGPSPGSPV